MKNLSWLGLVVVVAMAVLMGGAEEARAATYYVSNSTANGWAIGNDANSTAQAQSTSTPWLTIDGANTKATDGDTIIVNDGTYTENSGAAGYLSVSKSLTINPYTTGGATIRGTAASRVVNVNASGKTVVFGSVAIDGQGARQYAVNIGNASNLTFNGTTIGGATTYTVLNGNATANVTFTNATLTGTSTTVGGYYDQGVRTGGTVTFTGGSISETGLTSASGGSIVIIPSAMGASVSISGVTITNTGAGVAHTAIRVGNVNNAYINGNTINYTAGTGYGIWVYASSASFTAHTPTISNNTVNHSGTAGIMILHGTDGATAAKDLHNNGRIFGNICTGSTNSTALHGIMLGANTGGAVYNNKVSLASLPFLAKLNTGGILYNNEARSLTGNGYALRSKGSTNTQFFNNSIYLNSAGSATTRVGMMADEDTVIPTPSTGIIYRNNNIYADVASTGFASVPTTNGSNAATFGNNHYYTTQSLAANQWAYQGTNYGSLAAWQAARESSATLSDPLLASASVSDMQLSQLSPAIDIGTTDYATSTDYLGHPIYGSPDAGAYEYQPTFDIESDAPLYTGNLRIYADGQYRYTSATSSASTANFSVVPAEGTFAAHQSFSATANRPEWLNLSSFGWGTSKTWTASSSLATTTIYTVGDLTAGTYYNVNYRASDASATTTLSTIQADDSGELSFTYSAGYSTVDFEVAPDTAAPADFDFTSPSDNYRTADTTITFTWSASSDANAGLAKYQFYLDGNLDTDNIATTTTSITHSFTCGDSHTYFVKAWDENDNVTVTNTRTVIIRCSGGGGSTAARRAKVSTPPPPTASDLPTETPTAIAPLTSEAKAVLLQELQSKLSGLLQQLPASTFTTPIRPGDQGEAVRQLQTILARDKAIYPEGLITGYYGPMTKAAVVRFQTRAGIALTPATAGLVGPQTRAKLNELK